MTSPHPGQRSGSARSGSRTTTSATPASASSRHRPTWSATVPALHRCRVALGAAPARPAGPRPGRPPARRRGRRAPSTGATARPRQGRGRRRAQCCAQHRGLARVRRRSVAHARWPRRRTARPAAASAAPRRRRRRAARAPAAAAGSRASRARRAPGPRNGLLPGPHSTGSSCSASSSRAYRVAGGREVPAVGPVLVGEPGQAEAAHRAAAGQHVEGRDDLPEVRDVAVGDAGDQRAEPDRLGAGREVRQRGPALQHVVERPADLRDLPEVVHHVDRVEAGQLGRRGRLAQPGRGSPVPRRARANSPRCSAEPEPGRLLPLAPRGRRGLPERRGHHPDRLAA